MKIRILIVMCLVHLVSVKAQAQWVTFDPSNLAQSIINTTKNVVQTSTTATNMISNFQETKKIFEQGKEYYDALKKANNILKDARKVKETILMIGDIATIYVDSFQLMMQDDNFSVEELSAIALGYTKLLEESNNLIVELKEVVTLDSFSMNDKERIEIIDACYEKVRQYKNLVGYYTNKNISVSYLRSRKMGDTDRIMNLYGSSNSRYW